MARMKNQTLKTFTASVLFGLAPLAFAFDVAGLRIGDTVEQFEALESPAKEFLTITHDLKGTSFGFFIAKKVCQMMSARKRNSSTGSVTNMAA